MLSVIGLIINYLLGIYLLVLFARMILSWVPMFAPGWRPRGAMLVVAESIYTITDPPLKAIGRLIPPVRVGNAMLDVGFMVLWVLILLAQQLVSVLFL